MKTVIRFIGRTIFRTYVGLFVFLIAFSYPGNGIGPLKALLQTNSPGLYILGLGILLALPAAGLSMTRGRLGSYLRRKLSVRALGWTTLVIGMLFFLMATAVPIVDFKYSLLSLLAGLGLLVIGEPERRRNK